MTLMTLSALWSSALAGILLRSSSALYPLHHRCLAAQTHQRSRRPRESSVLTAERRPAWDHVLEDWGLTGLDLASFPSASVQLVRPPLVKVPSFLSSEECDDIIRLAHMQRAAGREATNYLNFRVNREVEERGESSEARELIASVQSGTSS